MNLRERYNQIDWEAKEAKVAAPATLANQAASNRPTPETLEQQRERVATLRAKIADDNARKEQERIAKLKHKHVARINGRVALVAGKPPTGGIGTFDRKSSTTKTNAIPDVIRTTGYARYCSPLTISGDGVVMY